MSIKSRALEGAGANPPGDAEVIDVELMRQISGFEVLWNAVPEPFEWTYTKQDMERLLEKLPEIE